MTATRDEVFFESGRRQQNTKLHHIHILLRIRIVHAGHSEPSRNDDEDNIQTAQSAQPRSNAATGRSNRGPR